jgi:hypothetical protein
MVTFAHRRRDGAIAVLLAVVFSVVTAACADRDARSAPTRAATPTAATADVETAFNRYVQAALARDGVTAANLVSAETHAFYDRMRDDALRLPEAQLSGRTPLQQITILVMRAEIDAATLERLAPEEVLVTTFELGLIDERTFADLTLDNVSISGDTAIADLVKGESRAENGFLFRREGGQWTLDLEPLLDRANGGFIALAEEEGFTPSEFVDRVMGAKYGEGALGDLRKPLIEE